MRRTLMKTGLIWLCISAFTGVFSIIYEMFSHGVYSMPMMLAFLIPLLGVSIPCIWAVRSGHDDWTKRISLPALSVWKSAVLALLLGCIFAGVLEIYGTTSRLLAVYFIAAGVLSAAAAVMQIAFRLVSRTKPSAVRSRVFSGVAQKRPLKTVL